MRRQRRNISIRLFNNGHMPDNVRSMEVVRRDRRVARTRRALLDAFYALLGERRYQAISVGDVVERADVGRSTFYQHFSGKDELLRHSMEPLLAMIADAAGAGDADRTRAAVAHLWERRSLARTLSCHAIVSASRRALADLVEVRLCLGADEEDGEMIRARAVQIAAAQLALIEAWTRGELSASQEQIVTRLRACARL
jgi:AcrR family transcriptional regulator